MLIEDREKGSYSESDPSLSTKFREAGFGFWHESDAGAILHPLEAAYLAKLGKTSFDGASPEKFILTQKKKDKLFPFALEVYSAIRSTGRMVRPFMKGAKYLRVYAPGVGRAEERPSQLLCLLPGKLPSSKSIEAEVKIAHLARLDLIVACGTEKETKFYKVSAYRF